MSDAPEACDEGEDRHDGNGELVVPLAALLRCLVRLDLVHDRLRFLDNIGGLLGDLLRQGFWVRRDGSLLVLACSLADGARRGGHGGLEVDGRQKEQDEENRKESWGWSSC